MQPKVIVNEEDVSEAQKPQDDNCYIAESLQYHLDTFVDRRYVNGKSFKAVYQSHASPSVQKSVVSDARQEARDTETVNQPY